MSIIFMQAVPFETSTSLTEMIYDLQFLRQTTSPKHAVSFILIVSFPQM